MPEQPTLRRNHVDAFLTWAAFRGWVSEPIRHWSEALRIRKIGFHLIIIHKRGLGYRPVHGDDAQELVELFNKWKREGGGE